MNIYYLQKRVLLSVFLFFCGFIACFGTNILGTDSAVIETHEPVPESLPVSSTPKTVVRLYALNQIPDSAEVRRAIFSEWLTAPIEDIIGKQEQLYTDSRGYSFRVTGQYASDMDGHYVISVIPLLTDYGVSDFNLVPQGTWMIYRSVTGGNPLLIKIYPRENPALSILLRPASIKAHTGKSLVDVCLFNAYVRKEISLGLSFDNLYALPLSLLRNLTQDVIPWGLFDPPLIYSAVEAMSDTVRERIYQLVALEDGCFDENGTPVYISNETPQHPMDMYTSLRVDQLSEEIIGGVSSAGFAKWVVDGMIKPVSRKGTFIQSLKRPTDVAHTHFTKPFIQNRNTFFGLDWIRNLAAAALSLNLGRTVYPQHAGIDVTWCPFALTKTVNGQGEALPAFLGYEENAGYQVSYLNPLFYYLAITEPGHFYLGCVNRVQGNPSLREYSEISVFFPYFDEWGSFHLDVFENGLRIPIDTFMEKNGDAYIALVRIRAPEVGLFDP